MAGMDLLYLMGKGQESRTGVPAVQYMQTKAAELSAQGNMISRLADLPQRLVKYAVPVAGTMMAAGGIASAIASGVAAKNTPQDLTSVVLSPDDVSRLQGTGINLSEFLVTGAPQSTSWMDYIEAGRSASSRSTFMQGLYDVLGVESGGELLGGALAGVIAGSMKKPASAVQTTPSVTVQQGGFDEFGDDLSGLGIGGFEGAMPESVDSSAGFTLGELFSGGIPIELLY